MKKIAILGSTGSVGTQTLDVVDKNPGCFDVIALSAHSNTDLLKKQIKKYKPRIVGVTDEKRAGDLQGVEKYKLFSGADAAVQVAASGAYDMLVNAVSGLFGVRATLAAVKDKKDVALANKETLVAAGSIVMPEVKKSGITLMPIDSEHSALFQCLSGEHKKHVHKLILTCSGGALRDKTKKELESVSIEEAMMHKTWKMGKKITIDSATLMNKGFEFLEAMWLFDLPPEKIDVVIHPQSIIHSMVEYRDGSILAQLSEPDMALPIQYALSYPERWDAPLERLAFTKDLTFSTPDVKRFPCLGYAMEAAQKMGTLPAAMNAANDFMVTKFLEGKCTFRAIARVIQKVMNNHKNNKNPTLSDIEKVIVQSQKDAEEYLGEMGV